MKKKLILLIILFIVTGCSSTTEIEISKSGVVKEKINLKEHIKNIEETGQSAQQYIDGTLDVFKGNLKLDNYKYSTFLEDNYMKAKIYNKYENLCDYIKNGQSSNFVFSDISCVKTDDYYELNGISDYFICDDDCYEYPEIYDLKLTIILPEKALLNNADEVNGTNYTWNFSVNDSKPKQISLKLKRYRIYEMVRNKIYPKLIFIIPITLCIIVGFILIHNYKKNKFDY